MMCILSDGRKRLRYVLRVLFSYVELCYGGDDVYVVCCEAIYDEYVWKCRNWGDHIICHGMTSRKYT